MSIYPKAIALVGHARYALHATYRGYRPGPPPASVPFEHRWQLGSAPPPTMSSSAIDNSLIDAAVIRACRTRHIHQSSFTPDRQMGTMLIRHILRGGARVPP
jgi:hypothetical protein